MRGLLLVAASVALIGAVDVAKALSANEMFSGCKAFVDGQMRTSQLGAMGNFCSGVLHGIAGMSKLLPLELQSCPPAASNAEQLARVALKYIEAKPQRMHEDFRLLAVEAFHQAWPCTSQ